MYLPEEIKRLICEDECNEDTIGKSDATVVIFKDSVLKIQEINDETEREHEVMEWLSNRLLVPKVLGFARDDKKNYLLMSRLHGKMAHDPSLLSNQDRAITLLAEAMKLLWKVDISDCPYNSNLDYKLKQAEYNVKNMVDMELVEPETFGKDGFHSPEDLLQWLYENRPEEDLAFTHGDFCLPNVFLNENSVAGFIDLGKCGVADRWVDIAICYRSLKSNLNGKYGAAPILNSKPELLFEKLGLEPNWEKIRYYMLLDELF